MLQIEQGFNSSENATEDIMSRMGTEHEIHETDFKSSSAHRTSLSKYDNRQTQLREEESDLMESFDDFDDNVSAMASTRGKRFKTQSSGGLNEEKVDQQE